MTNRNVDWKDIANSYYEKALALTVLLLLFAFLASPHIGLKPYMVELDEDIIIIHIPPVEPEKEIKPEIVKPRIEIVVEDDLSDEIEGDIPTIKTIPTTVLTPDLPFHGLRDDTIKPRIWEDPPEVIKQVAPVYPKFFREAGIEGQVVLDIEVLADGKVGEIEIKVSSNTGIGGFDEAAIEAVRQWEFQPAKTNGNAITCWVTLPISFRLE